MRHVIFACVHNAGRSQMAAAVFNQLADPSKTTAWSAGTQPAGSVHPEVVEVMKEFGVDLSAAKPQLLTAGMLTDASHLITMGCGDACPIAPRWTQKLDWPLEDPKGQPSEKVQAIRDEICTLVKKLLADNGWLK